MRLLDSAKTIDRAQGRCILIRREDPSREDGDGFSRLFFPGVPHPFHHLQFDRVDLAENAQGPPDHGPADGFFLVRPGYPVRLGVLFLHGLALAGKGGTRASHHVRFIYSFSDRGADRSQPSAGAGRQRRPGGFRRLRRGKPGAERKGYRQIEGSRSEGKKRRRRRPEGPRYLTRAQGMQGGLTRFRWKSNSLLLFSRCPRTFAFVTLIPKSVGTSPRGPNILATSCAPIFCR